MPEIKADEMEYVPTDNDLMFVSSWCEYLDQRLNHPKNPITSCDVISIYNLLGNVIDKIIQELPIMNIGIKCTAKQKKYSKYFGEWILKNCIEPKKFEYVTGFEDLHFLYYKLTELKVYIKYRMKNNKGEYIMKEKIFPMIQETVFMDQFIGMDQYFPSDDSNIVLHRVTIIDMHHFEYMNVKYDMRTINETELSLLPSEKILSALSKFTEVRILFNEEYYIVGENYCQIDSTFSPVGQLIEFSPTQLTFKPLNDDDVAAIKGDNYVITNREDVYKIWLRLGVNRKGDTITKSRMFDTSFIKKNCRDYILYNAVENSVIYLDYNRPVCGTWISTSKGNITFEAYEKHLSLYKIQSGYDDHEPKLIKCDNSDLIYEGLTFNLDVEPGKYVYIKREIANGKYHFDKALISSGRYVEIPSSGYDHFNTPGIEVKVDKIKEVYIVDVSCLKDKDFVLNK